MTKNDLNTYHNLSKNNKLYELSGWHIQSVNTGQGAFLYIYAYYTIRFLCTNSYLNLVNAY